MKFRVRYTSTFITGSRNETHRAIYIRSCGQQKSGAENLENPLVSVYIGPIYIILDYQYLYLLLLMGDVRVGVYACVLCVCHHVLLLRTGTFNMPTPYRWWVWEREAHINWSMVICQGNTRLELPWGLLALCRRTLGSECHRYAIAWPDKLGTGPMAHGGLNE